ncbi:glycosyltransferase family 1 protein [Aquisalimonas lutea]|uniref:glycosyltransferase family 4 protein n=1 Tax=Aquisalimonas lutea TaxID=1327750 RepID=UPI0025B31D61|nr:glycosyltransferase family 1 protein [Aquisalimonas lutea]MDN3517701.1 glycosyltransferase family 1 protein [Aquisalimonas lutea]
MHIGLVTETYRPEPNGVAMTLGTLVDHLRHRGHDIDLVIPARPDVPGTGASSVLALPGLPVPGYPSVRFGLPTVRRLVAHWRERTPDVVYVATQGPLGWAAVRAARRLGIAVVSGYHTHFSAYGRYYGMGLAAPLIEAYLRRFHQRTRVTLAPTARLAATLGERGFGDVAVLPRGVDTGRFRPQRRNPSLRQQWGVFPGSPVILYVGRLAAEKNVELAIRSFRAIEQAVPQARCIMVGDGPLRASLAAEHPDIVFTGSLSGPDLAAHYASADLFLFPSLTDTFGNVVLEAMASGLPVVAFDSGAAAEHMRSFDNGLLVPFGDAARFRAAATLLAREGRLRRRLGIHARASVTRQDWTTVADRFEGILACHAGIAGPVPASPAA